MAFEIISNQTDVADMLLNKYNSYTSIILWRSVQSGKTSDALRIASLFYKESVIISVSDNNTCLCSQNENRARVQGFTIHNYRTSDKLGDIEKFLGKKVIISMLMEINNLKALETLLFFNEDLPITLLIDEADKNKTVASADTKKKKGMTAEDESLFDEPEDEEVADGGLLPPVTMLLHQIKNVLKLRKNSRTIFVSATPLAVFTAEKDDWLCLYKKPYENYVGIGIDHPANIATNGRIVENRCKARDRWTGNFNDLTYNSFYSAVSFSVEQFVKAPNRCVDQEITQLCLISLENRKISQFMMGEIIKKQLAELKASDENVGKVGLFVMNGDTKSSAEETLADLINAQKLAGKTKIIIIAGFMASRGVSFTDFSRKDNMFELILQVHYTKKFFPLNSSMQVVGRLFGPARRTVNRPALICNHWCKQDVEVNFPEYYRMICEVAEFDCALLGRYNPARPPTQPENWRYLKRGGLNKYIYVSNNDADHLPIVP